MADIAAQGARINAHYEYLDVLHLWFKAPLAPKDLRWLNGHCGKVHTGRSLRIAEPAWFDTSYQQTLRLFQPDEEALRWLAKRNDVLLTHVELTLDVISEDAEELLGLIPAQFVQRWHRKRQPSRWENGNYRTGRLGQKGMVFQFYADRASKVTGEVDCFHAEAKVYGSAALRRLGIIHPRDLIGFNHDEFWQRNLVLLEVDRERLGRWWENKRAKTKRRTSTITERGYNVTRATGNLLCRVYGRDAFGNGSLQRLVNQLGRGPFLCNGGITFIQKDTV